MQSPTVTIANLLVDTQTGDICAKVNGSQQ